MAAATKTRKAEKTLLDAIADHQKAKRRKRHTPFRVIARRLVSKKTRGATLIVLGLAALAVLLFANGHAATFGVGFLVLCVLAEAWPELLRWGAVNRRLLVPFAALALMVVPAALVARSARVAGFAGLAALLAVVFVHVNLRARSALHSHAAGFIPRAWLPAAYLAAAWTILAAKAGITRPVVALLLVGWLGWAGRYWLANRARVAHQMPVADTWAKTIANPDYEHIEAGSRLLGSKLIGIRAVPGGWAATVLLPKGQKGSKVDGLLEVIASVYGVETVDVTVDQSTKANQRELFVLPRSPLRKPHKWARPDLDLASWVSTIGAYIDGARVQYVWCIPGSGPWHDLISGTTRAGKSRLLDQLLATSRAGGGYIVDWVIDPQNGQSLPDWQDEVDWFAPTVEDGLRMLRAAFAVMNARSVILARQEYTDRKGRTRRGVKGFTPTLEMPLLVLTIDEAHAVLTNPEAVQLLAQIAKMASKCGIKVRLITQLPVLAELGGSTVLRDMVASGNVIVLRTASRISGQVAFQGALAVDPVSIPRRMPDGTSSAGIGFALGAEARQAPMRLDWVEDPLDHLTGPVVRLPKVEAEAAGDDYANRSGQDAPGDEDVIDAEVISETYGDPEPAPLPNPEPAPATTEPPAATVVRGPGGITCADRIIQIVQAAGGARVARSDLAAQLLGTWKLQQITKTIRELCLDPTQPVWSDDNRDHLYYREAA